MQERRLRADANGFDLQGHRGAWGLVPINTLHSFAAAMEMGVTTIELDVGLSKDGHVVVNHDRHIAAGMYRGNGPLSAGDHQHSYVGRRIVDLTLAQLRTLTPVAQLGGRRVPLAIGRLDPALPSRIPTLAEVFHLCRLMGDEAVRFNVEAKVHPGRPAETAAPRCFVERLIETIQGSSITHRVMLSSFDWRILELARDLLPELDLTALITPSGPPGRMPGSWTAGIDVEGDRFKGNVAAAAQSIG
ncbi:MAG TPA: glycerophosphodiester phosphodiesterase family protein, partial [Actinomycetota bacterium]|nr:glycerophosphodiester phosphodiesterase family protein [Actinomycetota bacterium]